MATALAIATEACGSGTIPGSTGSGGSGAREAGGGSTGNSDGSTGARGGSTGGGGSAAVGGSGGVAGGDASSGDATGGIHTFRYVVNAPRLPSNRNTFAIDLNADGQTDNQFGAIVAALVQQGMDLQSEQDANIAAGQGLVLLSFATTDPALLVDQNASLDVYRALTTPSPDFSGAGTFMVDSSVPASNTKGQLSSGTFVPNPPATGAPPTKYQLLLPFFGDVPLIGTQVLLTGASSGLTLGQLNGAITQADLDAVVIPSLAQRLDTLGKQMPCSTDCQQILNLFDTDRNGTITTAEIASNALISALLAPDVDLLDAAGNYAPDAMNTSKDSLSVGIGFAAVKANFTP